MCDLSFFGKGGTLKYKFQLIYEGILPKYNLEQEHIIVYHLFFFNNIVQIFPNLEQLFEYKFLISF